MFLIITLNNLPIHTSDLFHFWRWRPRGITKDWKRKHSKTPEA